MKNIIKKLAIIFIIAACITSAFAGTNGGRVDTGAPIPGSRDNERVLYETELTKGNITEETFYRNVMAGGFSPSVVAQILEDGYLTPYAENFKAAGLLQSDYVVKKELEKTEFTVNKISQIMYAKGSNKVPMYSGASYAYETVGYLLNGTEVEVTGSTEDDWYEVIYKETIGYIPGIYLTDTSSETISSISGNMVSTIEIDNTSDVPILPETHMFDELNIDAHNALSVFMACGIADENYINIKSSAKQKYIPGYLLNQTTQDNMSGTINFLDSSGNIIYSVLLKNYEVNPEIEETFKLNIGAIVEKEKITFTEKAALSTPIELTIFGFKAGEKYRITSENDESVVSEAKAGQRGEITFTIKDLTSYQIKVCNQNTVTDKKDVQESKSETVSKVYVNFAIIVGSLLFISIVSILMFRERRK